MNMKTFSLCRHVGKNKPRKTQSFQFFYWSHLHFDGNDSKWCNCNEFVRAISSCFSSHNSQFSHVFTQSIMRFLCASRWWFKVAFFSQPFFVVSQISLNAVVIHRSRYMQRSSSEYMFICTCIRLSLNWIDFNICMFHSTLIQIRLGSIISELIPFSSSSSFCFNPNAPEYMSDVTHACKYFMGNNASC